MDSAPTGTLFGMSHARLTAYGAVLLLCGFVAWNVNQDKTIVATAPGDAQMRGADSADSLAGLADTANSELPAGITPLGANILAQSVLAYDQAAQAASSSEAGLSAVKDLGAAVMPEVSYKTYAAGDIKTAPDTSPDRVLAYRADLRVALEPLMQNKEYEMDIFANYVETKDPKYLTALHTAAANYRVAIANTEAVTAPADAAIYQAAILTAMSKFAATLDALATNATDPFASAALLRTFLDAQDTMLVSFNSMAKYSTQKML